MLIHPKTTLAKDLLDMLSKEGARVHFGQFAEDVFVLQHFRGKRRGFYVDCGAHHPTRYSNTFLLHRAFGWRGVNIDVDARAIEAFQRERPGDANVRSGLSDAAGEAELALFRDGAVNTLVGAVAATTNAKFGPMGVETVPVRPLRAILAEHVPEGAAVDYMNVDCEGLDLEVLSGNDWSRHRPALLSVEMKKISLARVAEEPVHRFLAGQGYEMVGYHFATAFFAPA